MSNRPRSAREKIKSVASLRKSLARTRGKVVFTNGCFDLLHTGHVRYLERARKLGDILVVALNSDPSVRRLKGRGRPINPLADRLEVMAALECVDFVTWFSADTPIHEIVTLAPDILVKGGDYRPDEIVGAREVRARGGKVTVIRFVPGRSTSKLIRKIGG